MIGEIDDLQEEFKDHLCVGCGDPCDCDFRMQKCGRCLKCLADGLENNSQGDLP
jgi:hypothetical protein